MNNVASAAVNYATTNVPPVVSYACQVVDVKPLSANTFQVELQSPVGAMLDYYAGQYLQLELSLSNHEKPQSLFYSIANSFDPGQPRRLQLFIQSSSERANSILQHLSHIRKNNEAVKVTLPMGRAFLQTNTNLPHVLIAAGSGISQVKCLMEGILKQQPDAEVAVYWSNKCADEFYLLDEFQACLEQYKNLSFTPILESAHSDWSGRSGYIYEVILEDVDNLDGTQMYLCGSPQMVYGTIDQLKIMGLQEVDCYSDVFEYAPKS